MYCGLVLWTLILASTAFFHIYVNSGCKRLNDRMATRLTKESQLKPQFTLYWWGDWEIISFLIGSPELFSFKGPSWMTGRCHILVLITGCSQLAIKLPWTMSQLHCIILLVLSADNVCKQFGPKSGLTKCQARFRCKLYDTDDIPERIVLKKLYFEKISRYDKKACNITKHVKS